MSSGSGRGRGWLNLDRNTEPPRPGISPTSPQFEENTADNNYESVDCDELIKIVNQLNVNDDGILYNQKIKCILEHLEAKCKTEENVKQTIQALFSACLNNADLASKMILLVTAQSFRREQIANVGIYRTFMYHLQDSFENASKLQSVNPVLFRNCVLMIGEFYNRIEMLMEMSYTFLLSPIIICLDKLLEAKSLPAVVLFTKQVHLNGISLAFQRTEEFNKLFIKVRLILMNEQSLSPAVKPWLLLSLDLHRYYFGILPDELFKFYEQHIGIDEMIYFRKPNYMLTTQSKEMFKIMNYYGKYVLNIPSNQDIIGNNVTITSNVMELVEKHLEEQQQQKQQKQKIILREKSGRPILGSGARKNHNQFSGDCSNNSSSSSSGGGGGSNNNGDGQDTVENKCNNNKEKSTTIDTNDNKTSIKKHNKGWEHDDRFDIDYS